MWRYLLIIVSCLMFESLGSKNFTAYWNISLHKCQINNVTLDLDQFGIVHNDGNEDHGDKVNIFYAIKFLFPNFDKQNKTINGGIPQLGNLTLHLDTFHKFYTNYEKPDYAGVSVFDFESYWPENGWPLPKINRDASLAWARSVHPNWTEYALREFSVASFNKTIQPFFKLPLVNNRAHSPKALIGYYHYPWCRNWNPPYNQCPQDMKDMNDRFQDTIFNASTALYPSAYLYKAHGPLYHDYLATLLDEANRVNLKGLPVLPYYWFRYHEEDTYLPDDVALNALWLIKSKGSSGVVLWGAFLTDKPACLKFQAYVNRFLGPTLKCMSEISEETMHSLNARYPVVSMSDPKSQQNLHLLTTILKTMCKLGA